MQDFHLLEKLANQNRKCIPERTVHAKGSGAYGTLTVTKDKIHKSQSTLGSPLPPHPWPQDHRLPTNQACRRHERAASGTGRAKDWLTASVRAFLRPLQGRVGCPCDPTVQRNPPAQNSVPLAAPNADRA
jgi:hypothetical protein